MSYDLKKRILDVVVALGLFVLFLPVWIIVPLLIYFDSGRPIIFKHRRVGQGGREFFLYKFRSMIPEADEILHKKNNELLRKFKDGDWKIENDPRITRLGKALRSLTIDEFPQLYNVISGDMSMVGPRAYVKKELDEQTKRYPQTKVYIDDILSVKPGITGPWQTSGRNEIPFEKRAKMDADYAKKQSITQDFFILFNTPRAMISKW
jgi:undecaprenyl-phosphate galactose phosphotransferase